MTKTQTRRPGYKCSPVTVYRLKVLGYTENDVFSMTLRKFYLIYDQYLEFNGLKKKDEELNLDLF